MYSLLFLNIQFSNKREYPEYVPFLTFPEVPVSGLETRVWRRLEAPKRVLRRQLFFSSFSNFPGGLSFFIINFYKNPGVSQKRGFSSSGRRCWASVLGVGGRR